MYYQALSKTDSMSAQPKMLRPQGGDVLGKRGTRKRVSLTMIITGSFTGVI